MLKAEKDAASKVIRLVGTIDETDDLLRVIGEVAPGSVVNCKQVSRINSVGVKAWVKYFSSLAQKNVSLRFDEMPPGLVEQLNIINNFACGYEVASVQIPFRCLKCSTSILGSMKSEDIKKVSFQIPPVACPKCKAEAQFDDDADEYFAFLQK